MEFVIAHLVEGEAGDRHRGLAREIADRFGVPYYLETGLPPHVTLKYPFEHEDEGEVARLLEAFAAGSAPAPMRFEGFGHFRRDVIFARPHLSEEAYGIFLRLLSRLGDVPGMQWQEYDGEDLALHATLACEDIEPRFDEIRQFVSRQGFEFEVPFDNVALFRKEGARWVLSRRLAFGAGDRA